MAVAALGFIAGDGERLGRFLAITGIGPESIRAAAREPDFLLGVLDYLVSDESLLLAFARENGFEPEHVAHAREVLAPASLQVVPVALPMDGPALAPRAELTRLIVG